MKTLKLEVGKTYRNRRGEEVKIVEKQEAVGRHAYRGSDDEWYTESGRFNMYVKKSEHDLIEEVPETRHAFTIPDDMKEITATRYTLAIPDGVKGINVLKEGNRIIVEMVPEDKEPKPGDIVFEDGRIMIVKKYPNLYHAMFYPKYGKLFINALYGVPFTSAAFRPATPEEAQPLWDALKKAGKRWNSETMQVEQRPEFNMILDWVEANIKDGYYNHEDVAEAIEAYLKHKEGER